MVPFPPPPFSPRLDDGQGLEHLVTLHARSTYLFSGTNEEASNLNSVFSFPFANGREVGGIVFETSLGGVFGSPGSLGL